MAEKRMFAKTVVESGAFYRMSAKAQCLYLHLCMNADDDGLLNNALVICRSLNFSKNILQELLDKRFVLDCGDDVMCIKHWKMSNTIAKDRYKPTIYQEEYQKLTIKDNKAYTERDNSVSEMYTKSQQNDDEKNTQVRLGKNRLLEEDNTTAHAYQNLLDEMEVIDGRCKEMGVSEEKLKEAKAIFYQYTILTPDFYQKVVNTMLDDNIYNKRGYVYEIANNYA